MLSKNSMIILLVLSLIFWGFGLACGGMIEEARSRSPDRVHKLVHSNQEICEGLGGVFEGDDEGSMCILDSCTTPSS